MNVVPDRCVIEVDRRTLPGEDHRAIVGRIESGLEELRREGAIRGFALELLKGGQPFSTARESALVGRLAESCQRRGIPSKLEGVAWYSNGGPLAETCRDLVVFGPGSIRQAHTSEEYIELDSLQAGCDVLREFLKLTLEGLRA